MTGGGGGAEFSCFAVWLTFVLNEVSLLRCGMTGGGGGAEFPCFAVWLTFVFNEVSLLRCGMTGGGGGDGRFLAALEISEMVVFFPEISEGNHLAGNFFLSTFMQMNDKT